MPVDTRVASGDTAILKCIPPRGNPKPRLIWLKNGQALISERDARWHITDVGSLVIEAVQKSDEANYACRAENMVGSRDSDSVRLSVHSKYFSDYFSLSISGRNCGEIDDNKIVAVKPWGSHPIIKDCSVHIYTSCLM